MVKLKDMDKTDPTLNIQYDLDDTYLKLSDTQNWFC